MKRAMIQTLGVLIGAFALTACTSTTGGPQIKSSPVPPAASSHLPRIPDGTYRAVVLKAERVKAGYPEGEVDNLLGADGRLDVTLRFAGLDFVVFVSEDSGEVVPGDAGTLQYDEDGLIMRSNSSGCPSCTYRYHWTLTDPRLVLEITEIIYDPGDGVAVKIVTNNTFTKVD